MRPDLSWLPVQPRPAPLIGEHTDEILKSLGYDAREITALHAEKVV